MAKVVMPRPQKQFESDVNEYHNIFKDSHYKLKDKIMFYYRPYSLKPYKQGK